MNRRDEVSAGAVALSAMFLLSLILYLAGVCLFFWYKSAGMPQTELNQFIDRYLAVALSAAPAGFIPAFGVTINELDFTHELRMRF